MNRLKKAIYYAIMRDIYNSDSYTIGKYIGKAVKKLQDDAMDVSTEEFLKGVKEGIDPENTEGV